MTQTRNISFIVFFTIVLLVASPVITRSASKQAAPEIATNATGDKTWAVRPLPGVNGSIYSITPADDGGFVFGGNKEIYDGKCENTGGCDKTLYIFKLDQAGNKMWEFSFGNSYIEACKSMTQTSDGGFIAACATKIKCPPPDKQKGFCNDIMVIKLSSTGELKWNKNYNEGIHFNFINKITPAPDGGYIICGSSRPDKDSLLDGWFFKINASGDMLWSKHLRIANANSVLHAQILPEEKIFAVELSKDGDDMYLLFLWIFPDGVEIGRKLIKLDNVAYLRMNAANDGGIIAAGASDIEISGVNNALIIRFNDSGNELWRKNLPASEIEHIGAAAESDGGSFTVVGSITKYHGKDRQCTSSESKCDYYWLMKLDDLGNVITEKTFGTGKSEYLTALSPLKDGGFIVAGRTSAFVDRTSRDEADDIQIMRLDENGDCGHCF